MPCRCLIEVSSKHGRPTFLVTRQSGFVRTCFLCAGFFGVVRPHFQPTTFYLLMSWFQGLVDRAEDRRDPELQSLTVPCVHEMCFVNSLLYDLGCKVIVSILQNQLPYTSPQKSSNHFSVCGARLEENFFRCVCNFYMGQIVTYLFGHLPKAKIIH